MKKIIINKAKKDKGKNSFKVDNTKEKKKKNKKLEESINIPIEDDKKNNINSKEDPLNTIIFYYTDEDGE